MGESSEIDDKINKLLIDHISQYPTLHNTNTYTESDEIHWDEIQQRTGIQKSWMKKRWKTIRNEHQKITIYNHTHSKKVPPHKMASLLKFLVVDLNAAHKMNFDDLKRPKITSFCVTQEMIDNCEISRDVTMDTIGIPIKTVPVPTIVKDPPNTVNDEPPPKNDVKPAIEVIPPKNETPSIIEQKEENIQIKPANNIEANTVVVNSNERSEDDIFGELVVAMLKKMTPDDKKRAKKEIMNILL